MDSFENLAVLQQKTAEQIETIIHLPLHHEYFTDQYLHISDITLKYKELFEAELKRVAIHTATTTNKKPIEDEGASCLMDERQQLDEATAKDSSQSTGTNKSTKTNYE
ncbi:hypothetical protein EVAR_101192_1 [Eumeta japonica]|uniref:Uncharacterized protein n=1 Tax=Eumeta variegata TaxID=151549 RepID=A0A4C1SMJ5_EUMVA|nr:hypothetical protein EVAR_101192_1 [Eumeta japonica]